MQRTEMYFPKFQSVKKNDQVLQEINNIED